MTAAVGRKEDGRLAGGAVPVEVSRSAWDVVVVTVDGQADLHAAPGLDAAIEQAIATGALGLVVDLSRATFVDSMTLGVLLGAVKRLRALGGTLTVVCLDPHVRRVFEITLLDRVFSLCSNRDEALLRASRA